MDEINGVVYIDIAEDMNITVDKSRVAKRSVYRAGAAKDDESVSNYYRISIYIPLLDGLCSQQTDRLGSAHKKVLSRMGLILVFTTSNFDTLKLASKLYSELLPAEYEIRCEFTFWKHKWTICEEAAKITRATSRRGPCESRQIC